MSWSSPEKRILTKTIVGEGTGFQGRESECQWCEPVKSVDTPEGVEAVTPPPVTESVDKS